MGIDTLKVVFSEDDEEAHLHDAAPANATRRVVDVDATVTRRVNEERTATRRVGGTLPNGQRVSLGTLMQGEIIGDGCIVEHTLFPHESQRPGLYLCQSSHGQVMVKVYATQYPPKPELWGSLVFLHHPNVIRTIRTMEENKYFLEIQEYCNGGTLEDLVPRPGSGIPPVSPDWVTHVLVPHISEGLRYLHQEGIIHRDIKPANIYVKRDGKSETLVLADFDISSVLEQTHTSRDTQRAGGTWIYTAPEAFPRFVDNQASGRRGRVSRSSDYYSLGITIIELLLGTTSLHQCQLPDLFDFYLQGGRVEVPRGIPGRLSLLLRGLLIRNRHTRWGAEELLRWLMHQTTDDDLKRINDDEQFEMASSVRPYRLNNLAAIDLPGLADSMAREYDIAMEDLLSGDVLLNWIGTLDNDIARKIRRDREDWRQEPVIALFCAIMRCDPTRPFIFPEGTEAYTLQEWLAHAIRMVRQNRTLLETLCSVQLLQRLEIWLRLKTEPELEMAQGVKAISQSPERVRLEELSYLIQPARPFPVTQKISAVTPQDFVKIAYGTPEDWQTRRKPICYEMAFMRWHEGGLEAWFRQRGLAQLAEQCDKVRTDLAEYPEAAFETVLRLIDPSLPLIEVEVDTSEVNSLRNVSFGKERTFILPYHTRGCGIPFGAVTITSRAPGAKLAKNMITQRVGTIQVTIDTRQDIPAYIIHQIALRLEGGVASFVNTPLAFNYRMIYPIEITITRMLSGAAVGALALGLPRLVLWYSGEWGPVLYGGRNLARTWEDTLRGYFPQGTFIISLLILFACIYIGLRIWFAAVRKSET